MPRIALIARNHWAWPRVRLRLGPSRPENDSVGSEIDGTVRLQ